MPEPEFEVIWAAQRKQAAFIACPCDDVAFGGARGGGKSDGVIGDWASHEDLYHEHAIGLALRRERTQLIELIERAKQILVPIGHKWHEQDKYFRGPNGGRLRFAYLENDSDADAYQGHGYTRLYIEEIGTFPAESPVAKLTATLRSGNGVPCQMKSTCNPGGPGHQWVKARYRLDTNPGGMEIYKFEYINPFTKKKIEKTRVFIPSKVVDNKYLGDDYVANLFQVGSENLVKAWLTGDWSVIEGAFFPEWSTEKHVIRPFEIPASWTRFRSGDWGSAKPFSIGWWAVAGDDFLLPRWDVVTPGSHSREAERSNVIPRGAIIRYREWYGASSPNVGLKLTAEAVADGIAEREIHEPRDEEGNPAISYGVLDPSCFDADGGPCIGETMAKPRYDKSGKLLRRGILFRRADNKRTAKVGSLGGWDQVRARLIGTANRDEKTGSIDWSTGDPMLYVFSTCRDLIRTLPALQHDAAKAEDVDTESEDHAPDEARYACMSRPYVKDVSKRTPGKILAVGPGNQVSLDDLWEQSGPRKSERV
jgi:hypothetical protein